MRGKRSANAVPILSRISMGAIAVVSAAMFIVSSVFNGFDDLNKELFKAFYPDVKVMPAKGKFMQLSPQQLAAVQNVKGVKQVSCTIEDNVLAVENNRLDTSAAQRYKPVVLKGIDNNYFNVNTVASYIEGAPIVKNGIIPQCIAGLYVAYELGADHRDDFSSILVNYPNASVTNPELDPVNAFQSLQLHPGGVFEVQSEFDAKYILAPIQAVQNLFGKAGYFSAIEISTTTGEANDVKAALLKLLGSKYKVESRFEQNRTFYMMLKIEGLMMRLIMIFIMCIASFSMVGALAMLTIEKQKDMAILRTMGAEPHTVRNIFLLEGITWSLIGGSIGVTLGIVICWAQSTFHLVKISEGFVTEVYPVLILPKDIFLILGTIIFVGIATAWVPAKRASKITLLNLKSSM